MLRFGRTDDPLRTALSSPRRSETSSASLRPRTHSIMVRLTKGRASSHFRQVSSSATTTATPAMLRQWARAWPVRLVLIRAVAMPAFENPIQAAMYSARLVITRAMTSVRRRFRLRAQWA